LCGRAIQPLAQLAQLLGRLNQSLASFAALTRIMSLPREHGSGVERLAHDRLRGSIELRDVSFNYPEQPMPLLHKVSLRIEPGERVAVIGRVGSGKSTLIKLLLGLYAPSEGALLVGGSDVRQIDPADLRRNVGSVLQDMWLMSGTLRQNIAVGGDRPSDAQVMAVAEVAGVHEFAVLHPSGYQLRLGEHGEGLSGGQRQAVGIARALVSDPPILLLDEPTSAMDPTAERLLLQRLKPAIAGKTLLLVTHKPSMLELVDRVIVIERGRIIANGPKDEVMRNAAQPRAGNSS
jgi:ATP-binding cassette subfamily C protein LapB